ncbi:uroporphyrinogen decarboxylase [Arcanobacterium bovis]|uniref:Uroporphyrinogen decarboxylase n=1 Tax=Arcanobacterium bovis TaxID=2529275 RepID=A0A4Q9V0I9_9ACTO|nr:uroporphyrinogen decarboxylase [Arcanobacterium bovis]TBW22096.1 uroporphyrinogen decarboxylase [Arcanobacterium bovis]
MTSNFLSALAGKRPEITPVWFMRQAGRSLPEYRKVRAGTSMLESCLIPELAAEITAQPVRRHGVDAAVYFSDITVPLKLAGVGVEIKPGVGPVMDKAYRSATDIRELIAHDPGDASAVAAGAELACAELNVPVLAFAGAPFTLAAYLVEGKPSRDHLAARSLMHTDPHSWFALADWCAKISIEFLKAQIKGGAEAFQLFDSWAGSLSKRDYLRFCAPSSASILKHDFGVPSIHFGLGTAAMLEEFARHTNCVGIDYRTDLAEAIKRLRAANSPNPLVVQGNIDPALLACPAEILDAHVDAVLSAGKQADAHILNLGHGVPKDTDPDVLTRLVARVHES